MWMNLVDAILLAGRSAENMGEDYFVSDGKPCSWREMTRKSVRPRAGQFEPSRFPVGVVRVVAAAGELAKKISGKLPC